MKIKVFFSVLFFFACISLAFGENHLTKTPQDNPYGEKGGVYSDGDGEVRCNAFAFYSIDAAMSRSGDINLSFYNIGGKKVLVKILNEDKTVVYNKSVSTSRKHLVKASEFPNGNYSLKVIDKKNNTLKTFRLRVQR